MPLRMLWKTGTCCVTVTEPCELPNELPPSCVDDDDDDNDDHDNDDDDEHDDERDDDDICEPSRPLQVFRFGSALEASLGPRGAVWGNFGGLVGPVGAVLGLSSGSPRGHWEALGCPPGAI